MEYFTTTGPASNTRVHNKRVNYALGMVLGQDDFDQEQYYFLERDRLHNRLLHGWGVVCGACVRRGGGECDVIVEPGYLLGPYGDEIVTSKSNRSAADDRTVTDSTSGNRVSVAAGCHG